VEGRPRRVFATRKKGGPKYHKPLAKRFGIAQKEAEKRGHGGVKGAPNLSNQGARTSQRSQEKKDFKKHRVEKGKNPCLMEAIRIPRNWHRKKGDWEKEEKKKKDKKRIPERGNDETRAEKVRVFVNLQKGKKPFRDLNAPTRGKRGVGAKDR